LLLLLVSFFLRSHSVVGVIFALLPSNQAAPEKKNKTQTGKTSVFLPATTQLSAFLGFVWFFFFIG